MFSLAKWAKPSGCIFKTSAITVCIKHFKLVLYKCVFRGRRLYVAWTLVRNDRRVRNTCIKNGWDQNRWNTKGDHPYVLCITTLTPMDYVLQYFVVLSYYFSGIKEKHHFNFLGRYNQFLRDRSKLVAQVNGKVKYQDLLSAVLLEVKV